MVDIARLQEYASDVKIFHIFVYTLSYVMAKPTSNDGSSTIASVGLARGRGDHNSDTLPCTYNPLMYY